MKLENNFLKVEINELGAEITRVYDKENDTEIIWEANPKFWKRHSPVLFPNVGKNYKNQVLINGKKYETSQHGFARDSIFKCINQCENSVEYMITANNETKKVYPFEFELIVGYELKEKEIIVTWQVNNKDSQPIYFTIGAHPAYRFKDGDKKEDYILMFNKKDSLEYMFLDSEYGTAIDSKKYQLSLDNGKYQLNEKIFENDALILDGGQVEEVWLCYKDGTKRAGMKCSGFPNFGIWSVKDAPFVCLEPWMGRCDNTGFEDELSTKDNVNKVEQGKTFKQSYSIIVA